MKHMALTDMKFSYLWLISRIMIRSQPLTRVSLKDLGLPVLQAKKLASKTFYILTYTNLIPTTLIVSLIKNIECCKVKADE